MDFNLSAGQLRIQQQARSFAAQEIEPIQHLLENDLSLRSKIFVEMAEQGFFLMNTSLQDKDYIKYALALIEIAKIDAGISVAMSIINMVTECIDIYGSKEQKDKYFSQIQRGENIPLSFAVTEKNAGSDAKNIETKALYKDKAYILNGEKQFITNADLAKTILVLAKNNQESISCFLLDKEISGFEIIKKEEKLGLLSVNLNDFALIDCKIPEENLLGKLGQGFEIAMHALNGGRIGIAAQSLGIAESAYKAALHYSKERVQFDHSLSDNQAIAFKLADMYVKLSAGFGLLYKACLAKNKGQDVTLAASTAKLYCTEAANDIVNEALQIFGGYGYTKNHPLERYYRDVRATTLYEGTSEIQRLIISRKILSENL